MKEEKKLWDKITKTTLSRRNVLQMGAFAGLCLAAGGPIFAFSKESKAQTKVLQIDKPQYGGILNVRLAGDPPNFDLVSNSTYMMQHTMMPVYNNLVIYDPMEPDSIIGDLAHKWEVSPDGKIYTFYLIKGVKFHDGKPCTSADVKFTFDHVRNPPQGVISLRKGTLSAVDGIETPDDYTVRFVLKQPSPSFLSVLASGWMAVLPKHVIEEKGDMKKVAIGTGPYKFKNYTRGVSLELVRNPEYHVKGRPYLDGITFFIIPDPGTAFANLRTGQLHMYFMTFDEVHTAQKEFPDKVVIQKGPYYVWSTLNFNSKRKPWDDVRVRQAVSLAIDRAESIKVLGFGAGDIGGIMHPKGPWALPTEELEKIPGYGKDTAANVANAKKLLAEAGYPNGFSTTMLTRKGTDFEPFSIFLKDQLAKIGVEAKLDVQESAVMMDYLNKRNFDMAPWVHGNAVDDPDAVFGEFYNCDAVRNYTQACSKEADEIFIKQSQTLDLKERKRLVNEMEKLNLLTFSKVVVYYWHRFVGFSPRVRNYKIHPSLYNNQRFQDAWMAKS